MTAPRRLVVPAGRNGPASSGNGGWTAGALAELVAADPGSAVEVTLRRPPPLDVELAVTDDDGTTRLWQGDDLVAEALGVPDDLEAVDPVDADRAADAMLRYPGLVDHPFPTCFACGTERAEGDGLRIFPGPVDPTVRDLVASLWVPHESHAESSDLVAMVEPPGPVQRCGLATTWAALDCVGGWSEDLAGRPCVLGRMTARVDARPQVGEPHVVVGRHLGRDGRKSFTASTLYDGDGRVVAAARHTWIQVDVAAFR